MSGGSGWAEAEEPSVPSFLFFPRAARGPVSRHSPLPSRRAGRRAGIASFSALGLLDVNLVCSNVRCHPLRHARGPRRAARAAPRHVLGRERAGGDQGAFGGLFAALDLSVGALRGCRGDGDGPLASEPGRCRVCARPHHRTLLTGPFSLPPPSPYPTVAFAQEMNKWRLVTFIAIPGCIGASRKAATSFRGARTEERGRRAGLERAQREGGTRGPRGEGRRAGARKGSRVCGEGGGDGAGGRAGFLLLHVALGGGAFVQRSFVVGCFAIWRECLVLIFLSPFFFFLVSVFVPCSQGFP